MTGDPKEWVLGYTTCGVGTTSFTHYSDTHHMKWFMDSHHHTDTYALSSSIETVDRSLQHREATIKVLKEHLHNAQHKMKTQADKKRSEREVAVGETWCL
ncbi:UNVERIFIED_CONTAM: hypothetical protein Sangu_2276200 [Sesamum angustifolium]|uniref:Uncharacterized protein n=1 Tax=Sesamum angustifolium TaxID=2727405 RepID=A0AAW2L880_9LAMI